MADKKVIVTKGKIDALASSISNKFDESLPLTLAEMKTTIDNINIINYDAGTGLTLSDTTFNHSNSVTPKTAAAQSAKTLGWGDTFNIYEEKYDAQGHITDVTSSQMTMPSNPNTHYTTHLYAGTSTGSANAATTNGNTYLIIADDVTVNDRRKISGTGATTVASDASGNITINSDNTTYSAMSVAEMKAGTATSSRVIRADYLKSAFTASDGIFKTGSANGTISVYGTDIAVKGLGSRAYDSTSYLPLTGGTLIGNLIVNNSAASETTILSANSLIATGIDVESNTSEVGFVFDGANKVIETTPNAAVYINGYLYANSDELTITSATNTVDDNTDVFLNSSLKMSSRTSVNSTPITKNVLYAYNGLDEGIGVLLQGDGTTVVAAGEAGRNLIKENVNNAQAGNGEQLHLASDTAIYFYSNCQTISDRKQISFGADGKLTVPGRIKQADPDALTAFGTYSTANTTVTLTSEYTNYNFLILRFGANNGDNSSMAGISTMIIPTSMINASNEFQHGWYHGSTWQNMKFQFPTTTSLKILTRVGSATGLRQVLAF